VSGRSTQRRSATPIHCCAATLLALAALGCGSARRGEPLAGALALTAEQQRGQQVFMHHCHACHPGGEAGLGPAINNKPLPGFLIGAQVRAGLGAMPGFSPQEISAGELDELVAYLRALRQHGS
jgi:mono/diheme cytochrome c family protein